MDAHQVDASQLRKRRRGRKAALARELTPNLRGSLFPVGVVEARRGTRPTVCFVDVQSVHRIISLLAFLLAQRLDLEGETRRLRALAQAAWRHRFRCGV